MARKILLADDSVTAQNMGRKILADAGYEVITVNNGSAALKKIAELKPDLIVLDVYMPGYSGLEVCQRVKEASETSRIPILLTVGKLEPFKPEEAKRVRADGYIVKPFEASELLSALTKLEDKIVPRAEASKPGRFARTIAVVEEGRYDEGRYDKTMNQKEDSGWKDRIGFPSGKKKKDSETEDIDDAAIYNQVNKDLRTVIDRAPAQEAKTDDVKIDLGALASQGLPKDVTPEEIAALAAAAAQIKGTIASTEAESSAAKPSEPMSETQVPAQIEAKAPVAVEDKIEATAIEPKAEAQIETKGEEKVEPVAEKPREIAADSPSPADVAAAITALEPATYLPANASSGNNSERRRSEDEPVTMAVASGSAGTSTSASVGSRWAAVATALLPEEATISLEHEMQKAYAAFAAADVGYASSAVSVAEPPSVAAPAPVEAPIVENSINVPAVQEEAVSTASLLPSEPAPASGFAAKNFEVAATPSGEPQPAVPPASEPSHVQSAEPVAEPGPEPPLSVEARAEEIPVAAISVPEGAPDQSASPSTEPVQAEQVQAEQAQAEQKREEQRREEQKQEDQKQEDQKHEALQAAEAQPAPASEAISESIPSPDLPPPAPFNEAPAEQAPASEAASQTSSEPAAVSATIARAEEIMQQESAPTESVPAEPAHKEPDIAATTAAAWATWRRIRESGDPKGAPAAAKSPEKNQEEKNEEVSLPHDAAAMAVAAGAERAPEGVPTADSEGSEIANIVDSVLADLRPKIVAEISKKMGKKK